MNVDDLVEILTDLQNQGYGSAEVQMASQPSHPLANRIASVGVTTGDDEDYDEDGCSDEPLVVWIAEGEHADNPYAPRAAWNH